VFKISSGGDFFSILLVVCVGNPDSYVAHASRRAASTLVSMSLCKLRGKKA
jgi:hypothetical protein